MNPSSGVRRNIRILLVVTLLVSSAFAVWSWFRPYAWNVDPAAACKVVGCQVKKDHAYFWVDVHLKVTEGRTHDLRKPVRLRTSAGGEIEPADTVMVGDDGTGTTDLWFKFWLETAELHQPLTLIINDGSLMIKSDPGIPQLGQAELKYFTTQHW